MSKNTYYTNKVRWQMAEAYLLFGTFRSAAAHTGWSKSSIHKTVNRLVDNGEFYDTGALKELIETNKKERALRGGMATAKNKKFEKQIKSS